jgi:hypothetical protein
LGSEAVVPSVRSSGDGVEDSEIARGGRDHPARARRRDRGCRYAISWRDGAASGEHQQERTEDTTRSDKDREPPFSQWTHNCTHFAMYRQHPNEAIAGGLSSERPRH